MEGERAPFLHGANPNYPSASRTPPEKGNSGRDLLQCELTGADVSVQAESAAAGSTE